MMSEAGSGDIRRSTPPRLFAAFSWSEDLLPEGLVFTKSKITLPDARSRIDSTALWKVDLEDRDPVSSFITLLELDCPTIQYSDERLNVGDFLLIIPVASYQVKRPFMISVYSVIGLPSQSKLYPGDCTL